MQHLISWLKPWAITMWVSTYRNLNIQNDYSYSLYSQLLFIMHVLSIIVYFCPQYTTVQSLSYTCTLLHYLIVHHLWFPILDSPFYFLLLAQVVVVTV